MRRASERARPAVSGVAALEHIQGLTRGDIHHRGHEPKPPATMRGLHHRLIEADHHGGADPVRVFDTQTDTLDRSPDRRPRHTEPSSDRRDRPFDRSDSIRGSHRRPSGEHAARRREVGLFVLRLGLESRSRHDQIRVPHAEQLVTVTVDSTAIVTSKPSWMTSSTLKLGAPNQIALLPSTRGLLDL